MITRMVIQKTIVQLIFGGALSCLYMLIRPYEAYTLAWPFGALGAWFILVAWFIYLKHDGLSILNLPRSNKPSMMSRFFKKFKTRSFIDYVDSPVETIDDLSDKERYLVKVISDSITGAIFFILCAII